MLALSTSKGLGFAKSCALAGFDKDQRASTAFKCFIERRLWLIIKTASNANSFCKAHLPTSAGNANSCSRPSILKEAVAAAAAEFLRLAGESVDGVALPNGSDKEALFAGGASGEPAAKRLPPAPAVV
jgi:hypothetical protein